MNQWTNSMNSRHQTRPCVTVSSPIVAGCTNTTQQKHAQHTSDTGRFARG